MSKFIPDFPHLAVTITVNYVSKYTVRELEGEVPFRSKLVLHWSCKD